MLIILFILPVFRSDPNDESRSKYNYLEMGYSTLNIKTGPESALKALDSPP